MQLYLTLNNFMNSNCVLILFVFIFSSIIARGQTYEDQYEKYSQELKEMKVVDSTYFSLVKIRECALVGTFSPDFSGTTVDDEKISLSALKGRVVVLNFWFTKCAPCIQEMPYFNRLVDTFLNKDVTFISFAPEETLKVKEFLSNHPFKFKNIANSEYVRRDLFKLFSIWPYTIIIDKEGKIAKMNFGLLDEESFYSYKTLLNSLL